MTSLGRFFDFRMSPADEHRLDWFKTGASPIAQGAPVTRLSSQTAVDELDPAFRDADGADVDVGALRRFRLALGDREREQESALLVEREAGERRLDDGLLDDDAAAAEGGDRKSTRLNSSH